MAITKHDLEQAVRRAKADTFRQVAQMLERKLTSGPAPDKSTVEDLLCYAQHQDDEFAAEARKRLKNSRSSVSAG